MTRMILGLLLSLSASGLQARVIYPHAFGNQELVWEAGTPHLSSRSQQTTVVLTLLEVERSRVWIGLSVINNSGLPLTVVDYRLSARNLSGDAVRIHSFADLEKREKRRRFWENVGLALTGAVQGYAAAGSGRSTSTTHLDGRVSVYGPGGPAHVNVRGVATTTSYDPAAARQALAESSEQLRALSEQLDLERQARANALRSEVFQTHTVSSGTSYSGYLMVDLPRRSKSGQALILTVPFGNDQHEYLLFLDAPPSASQVAALDRAFGKVGEVAPAHAASTGAAPDVPVATNPIRSIPAPPLRASGPSTTALEPMQPSPLMPVVASAQPIQATVSRPISPEITDYQFITDQGQRFVEFSIRFVVTGSLTNQSRLVIEDATGKPRIVLGYPIPAEKIARSAFAERVSIPVEDLPDGAEDWLRGTTAQGVRASYR